MNAFPPNSVILMKGDLPSNTFRYFELIEEKRPDLIFIDTQPMTYSWYLKKQAHRFTQLKFPAQKYRLRGEFLLENLYKEI